MIKLNVFWTKIQQYRFILQLADHVPIGLVRTPESANILRHFPTADIRLYESTDNTFEEFETIHENSAVECCQLRGVRFDGPFFSRAMLARLARGPKVKKLTFRGLLHSSRRKELKPYWEHCVEVPRDGVDKVWDEDYWNDLAQSEFAICPSGQLPWLYRHGEAAATFAIPAHTPEAEQSLFPTPFHHVALGRDPLIYSQRLAEENYQRLLLHLERECKKIELIRLTDHDIDAGSHN